jgi:hypothetical protein
VLTYKEKSLLLEVEVDLDARISVFEEKFPVFDNVAFFKCKKSRISFMERGLLELKNKGIVASSLGQFFSGANLYRVERKLRCSSSLEKWFGLASMSGYQDVFKLYEERKDRIIIALDFNSMYPSCMKGEFADPRLLKYKIFKDKNVDLERLQYGIYRVNLKTPKKSFFRSFHPFKYVESTKSFHFNMQNEDIIQCLLFKNEIEAYKEYFDEKVDKEVASLVKEAIDKLKNVFKIYENDGVISVEDIGNMLRYLNLNPSQKQLKENINELGYEATGRKYGVSGNSIRKWVKK